MCFDVPGSGPVDGIKTRTLASDAIEDKLSMNWGEGDEDDTAWHSTDNSMDKKKRTMLRRLKLAQRRAKAEIDVVVCNERVEVHNIEKRRQSESNGMGDTANPATKAEAEAAAAAGGGSASGMGVSTRGMAAAAAAVPRAAELRARRSAAAARCASSSSSSSEEEGLW
jgi:hypothetical protein